MLTSDQTKSINQWPPFMPILGSKDFCQGSLVDETAPNGAPVQACLMGWAGEVFGLRGLEEDDLKEVIQENPGSAFSKFVAALAGEKVGIQQVVAHDEHGDPLIGPDGKPVMVTTLSPDFGETAVSAVIHFNDKDDRPLKRLAEKWNRTVARCGYTTVVNG